MLQLLSVDEVAFTLMGYPMSYVELVGTVLYLWSVWLVAKRQMLTWPVGILSVLLYMVLFYQIRLYSDALEQVYYLAASAYGWWRWSRTGGGPGGVLRISYSSPCGIIAGLAVTVVLSIAAGALMSRIHVLLPALFPEKASFPYLDALTTVMSFVAMWLLAQKRAESWFYWIVVDVIGIGLYYVKNVRFIALLYVILLAMAVNGMVSWARAARRGGLLH
jgi:nicotinamide mononucleotide transporter